MARVDGAVVHAAGARTCGRGHRRRAAQLQAPLRIRIRIRARALKVRIARAHPGASPSAIEPDGAWNGLRALAATAAGRAPQRAPSA
ncbi:MAG TPA: hypothetical protein VMA77_04650 [Solirubrobacteraceae bacterium]|nr:hypothetical protein [Solirubrobacteraceae bacterium]